MKRWLCLVACLLFAAMPLMYVGQDASADTFDGKFDSFKRLDIDQFEKRFDRMKRLEILEFETMVGIDEPFLNPAVFRDILGGGLPWVLKTAEGELKANGKLEVEVEGLIIPKSASETVGGTNPAPFFLAAVSCIVSLDDFGDPVYENVFTEEEDTRMIGNPENGDAKIRAKLHLPETCIAPAIFVTSPNKMWFAVTGN